MAKKAHSCFTKQLKHLAESAQRGQPGEASSTAGAASAEEAYLQQRQDHYLSATANLIRNPEDLLCSLPGGIAKLPFMNGGLENAGIACKGGLNCIVEETGCAARTNTPRRTPGAPQDKDRLTSRLYGPCRQINCSLIFHRRSLKRRRAKKRRIDIDDICAVALVITPPVIKPAA